MNKSYLYAKRKQLRNIYGTGNRLYKNDINDSDISQIVSAGFANDCVDGLITSVFSACVDFSNYLIKEAGKVGRRQGN